jgi:hypothetical protein
VVLERAWGRGGWGDFDEAAGGIEGAGLDEVRAGVEEGADKSAKPFASVNMSAAVGRRDRSSAGYNPARHASSPRPTQRLRGERTREASQMT